MKSFFRCVLVVLAWLTAVGRADAQTNLFLYVTNSVSGTNPFSSLQVSNQLTYNIYVTNLTGFNFSDMLVTNFLVGPVQLVGGSNIYGSIFVFTNGASTNVVVFDLGENISGSIDAVSLTIQAAAAGYITNTITQASFDFTNTISTTQVTLATNAVLTGDLGVTVAGPVQQVIAYDFINYGITVTNSGPDALPNVLLTNNLPPDVILLGGSPAQSYNIFTNSTVTNLVFSIGTLAVGGSYNLQLFLQPTNAEATNILMASVGAPNWVDPNVTNNFASTNIPVLLYTTNFIAISTNLNARATNDPQTGLTEQSVVIFNASSFTVPAVRVLVGGLTNVLSNAVGTNGGLPFVYYSAPLHGHETETLLLQFSPRVASLSTNEVLYAFGLPFLPTWTPPASLTNNGSLTLNKIIKMPNGNMLVEFPATRGKVYTVVYSDNVEFSNAMMSPPVVVSPANEVQWIDYGPPGTVSTPAKAGARFYEVFPNP